MEIKCNLRLSIEYNLKHHPPKPKPKARGAFPRVSFKCHRFNPLFCHHPTMPKSTSKAPLDNDTRSADSDERKKKKEKKRSRKDDDAVDEESTACLGRHRLYVDNVVDQTRRSRKRRTRKA